MRKPHNQTYQQRYFPVEEFTGDLGAELRTLLGEREAPTILASSNRATQLIAAQSAQLAELAERGVLEPNRHVPLARLLTECYDQQGKCERIKNFPYPRQFATINLFFIRLFVWLLPFGLVGEFRDLGAGRIWLTIPFSYAVAWVFNAMERVGEATENPFEAGANEVPITALSRTIEIDLREMLGEQHGLEPLAPVNDILM